MSKNLLRLKGSRIVNNHNTHILTVYYPKQYGGNPDDGDWYDFLNVSQETAAEVLQTMIAAYNVCVTINADNPKQAVEILRILVEVAEQLPLDPGTVLIDKIVNLERLNDILHASETEK